MFRVCKIACIYVMFVMVSPPPLNAYTEIPQNQSEVAQDSITQEGGRGLLKAMQETLPREHALQQFCAHVGLG